MLLTNYEGLSPEKICKPAEMIVRYEGLSEDKLEKNCEAAEIIVKYGNITGSDDALLKRKSAEDKFDKNCQVIEMIVNYGNITGSDDALLKRKSVVCITTGSQALDELLKGGIETSAIMEIAPRTFTLTCPKTVTDPARGNEPFQLSQPTPQGPSHYTGFDAPTNAAFTLTHPRTVTENPAKGNEDEDFITNSLGVGSSADNFEEDSDSDDVNDSSADENGVRLGKGREDPNTQKCPMVAFLCFSRAEQENTKKENPSATFADIGRILGEKWSNISDAEKELAQVLARLIKIAEEFNVAAVMSDPRGGVFVTDPKKPAGAHVLAHVSTIRSTRSCSGVAASTAFEHVVKSSRLVQIIEVTVDADERNSTEAVVGSVEIRATDSWLVLALKVHWRSPVVNPQGPLMLPNVSGPDGERMSPYNCWAKRSIRYLRRDNSELIWPQNTWQQVFAGLDTIVVRGSWRM